MVSRGDWNVVQGTTSFARKDKLPELEQARAFALKDLIDQRPTSDDMSVAIAGGSANNIEGMADLSLTLSDPPTRAQVQEILTKLNQLIDALQH
jgi:hypothetical protein